MQPRNETPRWQRVATRILLHGGVAGMGAAVMGAAVLWPRWNRWQEARSALLIQQEMTTELRDREGELRTVQTSFDDWNSRKRRALRPAELAAFAAELRRLLQPTGVQIERLDMAAPQAPIATPAATTDPAAANTAALRPMAVTLVLEGSFPAIFRSLTRLEAQRFLALVRSAEMSRVAPNTDRLRAFVRADLFILQTNEDQLTATLPDEATVATGSSAPHQEPRAQSPEPRPKGA